MGNDVEKTVKLRDYKRKRFLLNKLKAKKIPPRLYAYLCEKLVINKPTPAEEIQVLQIMPEEKHIDYARINLPNLNIAGEGYDIDIKKFLPESFLAKNELNEAETFDISIVSDNGEHVLITFDANTYRFTCVTESPGEYDFILVRKVTGNDIIEIHSMPMHLIVNPDPKTLWKNIPSDSTDPYYKPDVDFRIISCGDSHSLLAQVRGEGHTLKTGVFAMTTLKCSMIKISSMQL